jgi:hypothetical protein
MHGAIPAIVLLAALSCGIPPSQPCENNHESVLAFPGAQGFGANTKGGRFGKVIEVTNLNDDGIGSFRHACEMSGPRIIVFKTGGNIALSKSIRITEPFLTIAGQTAPGDGITISGGTLMLSASEIIIRGLRIRVGSKRKGDWDGIALLPLENKPMKNIIIDHCSISWSIDENVSTNGRKAKLSNVTFSNNIISEGLNDPAKHSKGLPHSAGMLINKSGVDSISVIGNLFAHNKFRQPKVGMGASAEIVNNVMYNWATKNTTIAPETKVNIIGNYYVPGPDWNRKFKGIILSDELFGGSPGRVYVKDNLGPGKESAEAEEWSAVTGPRDWKVDSPLIDAGTIARPVESAYTHVLENSGAWPRDSHDRRVVEDVVNRTGRIIGSETEVGGLQSLETGMRPWDTDGDGLPDQWEYANGFDDNRHDDIHIDQNCNGYPDIEDYMNSMLPSHR